MPLERLAVDDSPHNRDGLVLHGYDGSSEVTAFISRLVIDDWNTHKPLERSGTVTWDGTEVLALYHAHLMPHDVSGDGGGKPSHVRCSGGP